MELLNDVLPGGVLEKFLKLNFKLVLVDFHWGVITEVRFNSAIKMSITLCRSKFTHQRVS